MKNLPLVKNYSPSPKIMQERAGRDTEEVGQYIPLHYHFQMLLDTSRLDAFRSAIEATIRPGMHVVDLGGGTGILSFFAARCGAKVTCIEANPELGECARQLIASNGLNDHVKVIEADAMHFIPERPVHAVVCEMLHVALLREKQIQVIEAFKKNYHAAGLGELPRFLPEASRLMFQLVEQSFHFGDYYAPIPMFQSPSIEATTATRELSLFVDYAHVFYDEPLTTQISWSGKVRATSSGVFSGLRFATQNAIAIDTVLGNGYPWANQLMILPIASPRLVAAGEEITIEFEYEAGGTIELLSRSVVTDADRTNRSRGTLKLFGKKMAA